MSLSSPILSAEMMATSKFTGVASKRFFDALSAGIVRSIRESTTSTIFFSGNSGSPGRAFLMGIPTSSEGRMQPLVLQNLRAKNIKGLASVYLANAIAKTAFDLFSAAVIKVDQVTGVANGTGVLSVGGISLSWTTSKNTLRQEVIAQGLHYNWGGITDGMDRIIEATAKALSQYLQLLAAPAIPVVGGSPSTGTSSVTMTGRYIS